VTALCAGVWLLVRALTLLSAPHPDWPIEKRRARDSADTAALMKLFRRPRPRVAAAERPGHRALDCRGSG
jgi:hypothetical protein